MVLVRVRSQGDALLKRSVVPWIIEEDVIVLQSVEGMLPELTRPMTVPEFTEAYELWANGHAIDLYANVSESKVTAGCDVVIRPRPPAHAGTASNTASIRQPAPQSMTHLQQGQPSASSLPAPSTNLLPPTRPVAASSPRTAAAANLGGGQGHPKNTQPAVDHDTAFERFLEANHVPHFRVPFAGAGVRTLADLTSQTAAQVSVVTGDSLMAFRLISAAHDEMRRRGLQIDWAGRIAMLYRQYNPGKADQVPSLIRAYTGEEEALWRSVREKYEPELATQSALMGAGSPAKSRGADGQDRHVSPSRSAANVTGPAGLVRSATSATGEVVYCPACRHGFVHVPTVSEVSHAEEMKRAQSAAVEERTQQSVLQQELGDTIQHLTEKLSDSQQVAQHYESVCREQEQWIRMLEQRLADVNSSVGEAMLSSPGGDRSPGRVRTLQEPLEHSSPAQAPSSSEHAPRQSVAERARLRRRLVDFYLKYSPDKVEMVDAVLLQWAGRESELERLIAVEPTVVRLNASQAAPQLPHHQSTSGTGGVR